MKLKQIVSVWGEIMRESFIAINVITIVLSITVAFIFPALMPILFLMCMGTCMLVQFSLLTEFTLLAQILIWFGTIIFTNIWLYATAFVAGMIKMGESGGYGAAGVAILLIIINYVLIFPILLYLINNLVGYRADKSSYVRLISKYLLVFFVIDVIVIAIWGFS